MEYADETIDRVELTAKIKEQMERYHNDVVLDSMESENLDYEALNHYIIDHLFRDVGACFNLPEKRQREQAKRSLIHSAYSYAKASTFEQKKACFSLYSDFYANGRTPLSAKGRKTKIYF